MSRKTLGWSVLAAAVLGLGGWSYFVTAPDIESQVTSGRSDVALTTQHPISASVDGRDITLSGLANDAAEREALLDAYDKVVGRRVVNDQLTVLEQVSPYMLTAAEGADGLVLTGNVPTEVIRAEMGVALDADPSTLVLAAGAPDDSWLSAIEQGVSTFPLVDDATLQITDREVLITGATSNPYHIEEVQSILAALPEGYTGRYEIALERAAPYLFSGQKTADGVAYSAMSPSVSAGEEMQAAFEPGAALDLIPAAGAPDRNWAAAVAVASNALSLAEAGEVSITDRVVNFRANAPSLEVQDAIIEAFENLPDGYELASLTVDVPPAVPYLFNGTKDASGISYSGYVPSDAARAEFSEFIGQPAAAELDRRAGMPDGFWPDFVREAVAALGALEAGEVAIEDRTLRVTGLAANPVIAQAVEAALSDLPAGYAAEFDLSLEDDGQPTVLALAYDIGRPTSVSGKLPQGLSVSDIGSLLNLEDMTGEPRASVLSGIEFYEDRLRQLRNAIPAFTTFNATFSETETKISGVLRPSQSAEDLNAVLVGIFGEGAEISLQETRTDVAEGTVRTNELTSELEIFRAGIWQPFNSVNELVANCSERVDAKLSDAKIEFATGSAAIDFASNTLIEEIAAIVVPCIANSTALIELGGHTDSQGDPNANLALSEARANAVRDALVALGVPATRISAQGFGASDPIATNDTAEGRAANRRTTFNWVLE